MIKIAHLCHKICQIVILLSLKLILILIKISYVKSFLEEYVPISNVVS